MKVYFVRHGETDANALGVHQSPLVGLNEKGRGQVQFLAERLQKIPIDFIYSSALPRAKETVAIINEKLNKPSEFTDLLSEIKQPSELYGLMEGDPEAKRIQKLRIENFGKPGWKFSDEENFENRKERAIKFVDHLIASGKENILVVTHGGFGRVIISLLMFGKEYTPVEDRKLFSFFQSYNTGITFCEYSDGKWQLITWNDLAHLG